MPEIHIELTENEFELFQDIITSYADCGPEGEQWPSAKVARLQDKFNLLVFGDKEPRLTSFYNKES